MTDQERLAQAIERLKATGEIEYAGEFGAEITTFIPFVCWLKTQGLLEGRRVVTYAGMRPYYYFLADAEYGEKPGVRHWVRNEQRGWPSNSTYTATRQPWHIMPDYRARYRDQGMSFPRPVLFIQNKFTVEWDAGPVNYLPLWAIDTLLRMFATHFSVVYSRPRTLKRDGGYTADGNGHCDYPDLAMVRGFPEVLILEDYCADTGAPYNQTKLEILAKHHLSVSVQGGGAHLLACFGGAVMLLYHREGEEMPHAYAAGPYKYLANPPPALMLAHDRKQLIEGLNVLGAARVENGHVRLRKHVVPLFEALKV